MKDPIWEWIERLSWITAILAAAIPVRQLFRKPQVPKDTQPVSDRDETGQSKTLFETPPRENAKPRQESQNYITNSLLDVMPRGLRLIEYTPGRVLHIKSIREGERWSFPKILVFLVYSGIGLDIVLQQSSRDIGAQIWSTILYIFVCVFILWPFATSRLRFGSSVRILIDRTEVWIIQSFTVYGGGWPPETRERQTFNPATKKYELEIFINGVCIWSETAIKPQENYEKTGHFIAALYSISEIKAKPRTLTWLNPWRG